MLVSSNFTSTISSFFVSSRRTFFLGLFFNFFYLLISWKRNSSPFPKPLSNMYSFPTIPRGYYKCVLRSRRITGLFTYSICCLKRNNFLPSKFLASSEAICCFYDDDRSTPFKILFLLFVYFFQKSNILLFLL
jgi:hypothetical protein